MKTIVLLSTYNGEKYLKDQLDSLLWQTQSGIEILVRDDGSTDNTHAILNEYQNRGVLHWYQGEHLGPAYSFWQLLCTSAEADYFAFCDQDDVWDQDKLKIAILALKKNRPEEPALYFSDVRVTDSNFCTISDHMVERAPVDFPHSLIKNIAPGCTFVFNRAAKELLCHYDAERYGIELHDWMTYQIISCFGTVYFDKGSHMDYRQHSENVIGDTVTKRKHRIKKFLAFWCGDMKNSRERNALRLKQVYGSMMSDENYKFIKGFAYYRKNKSLKKELLKNRELRIQGIDYLFFKILLMFNKI